MGKIMRKYCILLYSVIRRFFRDHPRNNVFFGMCAYYLIVVSVVFFVRNHIVLTILSNVCAFFIAVPMSYGALLEIDQE